MMQDHPSRNLKFGHGSVQARRGEWRYRFYADVEKDGKTIRRQCSVVLGRADEMDVDQAVELAKTYRVGAQAGIITKSKDLDMPPRHFFPAAKAAHYGAVAEYITACNLMMLGLEVFRNMNPAGSVDLLALDGHGKSYRVEVKSGSVSWRGRHSVYRKNLNATRYDVLAVVDSSWKVFYFDNRDEKIVFTGDGMFKSSIKFEEHAEKLVNF